jgi:sugar phosphate isomerase/epimerase
MRLAAPLTISPAQPFAPKAAACKRAGFSAVQLHFAGEPTRDFVSEALGVCQSEGLEILAIGCYGNPLQRSSRGSHGVSADDLRLLLENLSPRALDAEPWRIVTFSGTLSGQLQTPHPGNRTPGALMEIKNWAREMIPVLKQRGAQLLFKPHNAHAFSSAAVVVTFLTELESPQLGVALDVCSFMTPKNFHEREASMAESVALLAPHAGIACLRDAKIENFNIAYVGPGQGQVGYAGLLRKLQRYCPKIPWTIECPESEQKLKHALAYVQLQARLAGIEESSTSSS